MSLSFLFFLILAHLQKQGTCQSAISMVILPKLLHKYPVYRGCESSGLVAENKDGGLSHS